MTTCEIFLYIIPVTDYIDNYVPRLLFFTLLEGITVLAARTSPEFGVSLSFVRHVKRACATSAPIFLRSLLRDLLLLQSPECELACRLSLLPQGTVDDEGFVFSLRLTSYTSVTK